jgi:hypothetical protein
MALESSLRSLSPSSGFTVILTRSCRTSLGLDGLAPSQERLTYAESLLNKRRKLHANGGIAKDKKLVLPLSLNQLSSAQLSKRQERMGVRRKHF